MRILLRTVMRLQRLLSYTRTLLVAVLVPSQRQLLRQVLRVGRRLPYLLEQPLPEALAQLTPQPAGSELAPATIRQIVDAATAFGIGRPLGICLRRSLLRYYFLRRAGLPLVVHFGARREESELSGHAWLTLAGQPYHEPPQQHQGYIVMFSYPEERSNEHI